jgi:hypothetical protein
MTEDNLVQRIENLLRETAESHHQAFIATQGEGPEWPLWYGENSLQKMRTLLNANFTKSELVYMLVSAEKENGYEAPGAEWIKFYSKFFIERYA